jgi:hypothetical protein
MPRQRLRLERVGLQQIDERPQLGSERPRRRRIEQESRADLLREACGLEHGLVWHLELRDDACGAPERGGCSLHIGRRDLLVRAERHEDLFLTVLRNPNERRTRRLGLARLDVRDVDAFALDARARRLALRVAPDAAHHRDACA